MSLVIPALSDVISRILADISSRLSAEELARWSDPVVYGRALAGEAYGLYGHINLVADQLFVDTCDEDFLTRHGSLWGVPRKVAAAATGTVIFVGDAGAPIPLAAQLRAPDGVLYQTAAEAIISSVQTSVPIAAVEPGAVGNRPAGQVFTLVSPVPGVQAAATASALSGGADAEEIDAWRARILYRIQNPPMNGARHDYIAWALEVPGVTRAWCMPLAMGDGTVLVYFVRDNDGAGAEIMPDASEIQAVFDHIEPLRPVTAHLFVGALTASPVDFEIANLSPDTPSVRQAIIAELTDLVTRTAAPAGTLLLSHIRAAISAAAGENDFVLVLPASNVVTDPGKMAIMGGVTWS